MLGQVNGEEMAEQLRVAASLLHEVRGYLERLPRVPATVELCDRVAAFLEHGGSAAIEDAHTISAQRNIQRGAAFLPTGLPIIEATLNGSSLRIKSPHIANKAVAARAIQALKGDGLEVRLTRQGDQE